MSHSAWYAVFTKPRLESTANLHLQRQGFTTFLPQIAENRRISGSWQQQVVPMFPRYLFLQANSSQQSLAVIRSTRGAVGLVRFGMRPCTVPEQLIESLKTHSEQQLQTPPSVPFTPGQPVRIVEGIFSGYEAVLHAQTANQRVEILLDLLGQPQTLSFSPDMLEPI